MPHFTPLLLLIPTVFGQFATTRLDLNKLLFQTDQPFFTYFPTGTTGYGMNVQCECTASTAKGQAEGQTSKLYPANPNDRTVSIDNMSFGLNNPADWITLTCTVKLRFTTDEGTPLTATGFVQLFNAANDDNFAPYDYPKDGVSKRFTNPPDWSLTASINKRCDGSEVSNFNCDSQCSSFTCNNKPNICCTEQADPDRCSCISNPFTSSSTRVTPNPGNNNNDDYCTKEDLYFWIMIGLACLSGLLLILLIICLSYICCALSNEDEARKAQQQPPPEAVRPPPPVYLSTPPRDPRYGYRGPPLDPYGRPEAGYREETRTLIH